MLVFEIAVDRLGAADDNCLGLVDCEVLSKNASVGVRVVASDDDKSVKVKGCAVLQRVFFVNSTLNLVPSSAYRNKGVRIFW